jgi:type III restriction enzyme
MTQLYQVLAEKILDWKRSNYHTEYSTIAEILDWADNPDGSGFKLRPPQIRALETYWYLRLIEETPHILDLYLKLFPSKNELLQSLGVDERAFAQLDYDLKTLWGAIHTDDKFVQKNRLHTLRETLTLEYPSYILALAMGSGKTALIGAIIATEFVMALEYPQGPFVQNALVFAPGLTIIEPLREIVQLPYERILPERLHKQFAASVKITFTRDGDPEIPIIEGSLFNVVVTNTEKIRIQKEKIRKSDIGALFAPSEKEDEARTEIANRRLRKIASLPHLAVFSDEAHHTYGQALGTELKKVRKTVDYLHHNSPNLICVVNTTGTPYYKRQLLRDVVVWYSLSEGIRQGILKDVSDNIFAYDFKENVEAYVTHVIEDFFEEYGSVTLPDGTPSKIALYFPQTKDVEELRPGIEAKLLQMGLTTDIILEHHTKNDNKVAFDRFRVSDSPHRVALLVDRGVEGWDVPALFACALARRLTSSSFVLQAACRCLRQIPGNKKKARIYLSMDNRSILDKQLQETYGESLDDLNRTTRKSTSARIVLRKIDIPPLYVKQIVRSVVRRKIGELSLILKKPDIEYDKSITEVKLTFKERQATRSVLEQIGEEVKIESMPDVVDHYTATVDLASIYKLDYWTVYDELTRIYDGSEVPIIHVTELRNQIENQLGDYEVQEETVESGLALVKVDGFDKETQNGAEIYSAEITYPIDKEKLLMHWKDEKFGFHYTPYNFDSNPEKYFFEQLLTHVGTTPEEVEDVYFTGALTDPKKTEFYVEYKGEDERWHRYTPDFIIRRKDGKTLIVEIKDARFKDTTDEDIQRSSRGEKILSVEGQKAVALKRWQDLDPESIKYKIVYTKTEAIAHDETIPIFNFIKKE